MRRVRRASPSNVASTFVGAPAPTTSIVCSVAVAVPVFGITNSCARTARVDETNGAATTGVSTSCARAGSTAIRQTATGKIRSCTVRIDELSETQFFVGADWEDKTETTIAGSFPDCALQHGECLLSHTLLKKLPRAIEGRRRVLSNQPIHAPSTKIPYHCRSC
jgi:hypothetical protein